jgi:uncharacterized protein YjbI with pentapeptide repeats
MDGPPTKARKPRLLLLLGFLIAVAIICWPRITDWVKSQFPGKTRWDFLERVIIPISSPAGIAFGIWWLNTKATSREEKMALHQREDEVVAEFIKEMTPLLLERGLKDAQSDSEVVAVARALTMATLFRLKSTQAPRHRKIVLRYLIDAGVTNSGMLFTFPDADLSGANLDGARLRHAKFNRVNFTCASLVKADLGLAELNEANFTSAQMSRADLSGAKLNKAILTAATLAEADLSNTVIEYTDFSQAWLRGATFECAIIYRASFCRADLSRANFNTTELNTIDFSEARLYGADLSKADLRMANLQHVKWDEKTKWPESSKFEDATNIPSALKEHLGL